MTLHRQPGDPSKRVARHHTTTRSVPSHQRVQRSRWGALLWVALLTLHLPAADVAPRLLLESMRHLRSGPTREWSDFPELAQSDHLELHFAASPGGTSSTLSVRQQDVKQNWSVRLNGKPLGKLRQNENAMRVYFEVPAGRLRRGDNTLHIASTSRRGSDDIRVGAIALYERSLDRVLNETTLQVDVVDTTRGAPTPCRLTIVNAAGALQSLGAAAGPQRAVRPGIVYTATGRAQFGLPAGKYTIYAGRGFEYSLATAQLSLRRGEQRQLTLNIRREVDTTGYVACDPHVHSRTHSGHGDATVQERMITLAGEGIELPIATDHNRHVDHAPLARQLNVQSYFTPVIGNEVTTAVGHFNVFPVAAGSPPPDHRGTHWPDVFRAIRRVPGLQVIILNHGRDLHSGVRPLGPAWHNALVGENLRGWEIGFNAMEIVNSAATQSDPLQLFHDWLGLLNRGWRVAPIGSSDSHDVGRHFVGQGRTYIRCPDGAAGKIDITAAARQLTAGRVLMSYGLLTELTVAQKYLPGDRASLDTPTIRVDVRVRGPHWVRADRVALFANGQLCREHQIAADETMPGAGILCQQTWEIPRPGHDVHLVALATGPGIRPLYWPTAKPYQPTSNDPTTTLVGCSGAIWLDVDGDGQSTSAYSIAQKLVAAADGDLQRLLATLADYDAAVVAQAAHQLHRADELLLTTDAQRAIRAAAPATRDAIGRYLQAWRETELARRDR